MASFSFNLLTLKIKLTAGPLRKVTIPDYYTFGHLHQLFLFLFDWDDSHLHRFEVPKELDESQVPSADSPLFRYALQCMSNNWVWISNPMSFVGGGQEEKDEADIALSFGFKNVGDSVEYEYDFGDSWRAKINLENIEAKRVKKSEYTPGIIVVGGRGKTVPEYGGEGGKRYNKKKLNEALLEMSQFVLYPLNVNAYEEDQEEDEDDDLQHDRNHNKASKSKQSSVLGKSKRQNENANKNIKKQRIN